MDPSDGGHLPVQFPGYPGSYGLLSDMGATAAIVFVHGFWGDAAETWQQFQLLIDKPEFQWDFAKADLLFYDYESQVHTIKKAAENLGTFVTHMLKTGPASAVLDGVTLPGLHAPFSDAKRDYYDKVLLVGHSLGGVLIRQLITVIADGTAKPAQGEDWPTLLRRHPRLFAPAHSGFRQGDLVSMLAAHSRIAAIVIGYWRHRRAKAYAELQPGSPALNSVKDRTLFCRTRLAGCPALYATVLWGTDENVVFDTDYVEDDSRKSIDGQDHQSICKPTEEYDKPLEFVSRGLD